MKTCKDCIGYVYDFCDFHYTEEEMQEYEINDMSESCHFFKDKAKFIELPCPIGESVYMISSGRDEWTGNYFTMVIKTPFKLDMMNMFNKRVFLTREEAEKKLEENK